MSRKKIATSVFFLMAGIVGVFIFLRAPISQTYRIGVINYSPAAEVALLGLKGGLQDLGYREGENIQFLYEGCIRDKGALYQEALRLEKQHVDMIFAMSTPAALAAKKATETSRLPIVFGPVSSPVKAGIVSSLSRPGGNITGVTFGPQEGRRLEMLLKILPHVKTIYVPFNPYDQSPVLGIERLRLPAEKLHVKLLEVHIRSKQELLAALENFPEHVDAVFLPTDSLMVSLSDLFVSFSLENKIPLSSPHREGVQQGALFSYGFSIRDVGIQASRLVDKVLQGAGPETLPVELSEFVLAVNLKTAEAIRVNVPDQLLRHAIIFR